MGKRLLIFAIIFLSLLAFTIWRAQPPFRLQRKLLAKLPYEPGNVLITDLDDDGHPEVMAIRANRPPVWVRFPFDKPSILPFENWQAIQMRVPCCQFVPKALPVWTVDRRLRLLRWKDEKAILEPLPNLPDVPMEDAFVDQGAGTEMVFLDVYRGENVWVFILSPQGEWQFASRFTSQAIRFYSVRICSITDLADLDRDGFLDALWVQDKGVAQVFWGGRKGEKTDLGVCIRFGYPQIADLDGDGWAEIVMVAEDRRLKIWRFDRRERRLKVIATSPPLPVAWEYFSLSLFDLDEDGRKEIVVTDEGGDFWVFRWRDGKLKMWQGKTGLKEALYWEQVKFGDHLALCTYQSRPFWLFPPRIWFKGWRLQWQFQDKVGFSVFCLLPKGEKALSPSNWRIQEAPFELRFAGDMDGDGSDEVIGYDGRWRCWRLYRAEVTEVGELRWRDVLLGREEPWAFAMLVDGKRRGLVVVWEDGRLELLTMESRK
jgi:hypothetical protein